MKVIVDAGAPIEIGTTEATPTIGIIDYSRRVTDDFGVTTVVERGFSRRMSIRMALPFDQVDGVQQLLAGLRATAAQWVADDDIAWLQPTGFYKDFDVDLNVPPLSFCTLTVEGLAETETVADPGGDPAPEGAASTLQMLLPVPVTAAVLASSTVPEDDGTVWGATITYALGARVIRTGSQRVFESLTAGNIGHDPLTSPAQWLDVGPKNRWAMFDEALGSATSATGGSIVVTLDAGAVGAVALLDVVGSTVQVEVIATGDVDPTYDRTIAAAGGAIGFYDLPGIDGSVRVTISGAGTVSVGTLLIGDLVGLGITEASPSAGITDYSRKNVDDFGEVTIVQRAWAKRMTANALIRSDAVDVVADRIAAVRARPVLWVGDAGLDSLTVYGFFRDFSIEVGDAVSKLSLSIEGLSKAQPQAAPWAADIAAIGAKVDRIASDGYLSASEKPQAAIDYNALLADLDALDDRYVALDSPADITPFRDDATAKVGALTTYLTGLAPSWTDTTQDTAIDAVLYQQRWVDAYTAVAAFQAAITGRQGPQGTAGLSIAELTIFKRSATGAPATPTGGSYDFATKVLTPPAGWSWGSLPAGTDPAYAARGVASIVGQTGTDVPDWLGVGPAFANGDPGQAVDVIFTRSATQPATPAASSGVPAGWYGDTGSVPAGADPIWASFGTRATPAGNWTWQAPKRQEGQDGAGAFGLVAGSNVTITPNSITKSGGGSSWNASARSREGYIGDVEVSAQINDVTKGFMLGLNSDNPDSDESYVGLDFAIYCYATAIGGTGVWIAYKDGTSVGPAGPAMANGDVIRVRRRGTTIEFSVNGNAPFHTIPGVSATTKLFMDCSLLTVGAKIESLTFKPVGADGAAGLSIAELTIFKRSASGTPATPSGGSYDFATKVLTPPAGWTWGSLPAGTDPAYAARGVASIVGQTGTDVPDWLGVGPAFANGDPGQAVDVIFTRSATQPSTPAASSGVPAGWYSDTGSVPAGADPIWASFGTRPTPTNNWTWQVPKRQEGQDGATGPAAYTLSPASQAFTINCASNGTPKAGQFNKTVTFALTQAATDLTSDPATSFAIIGTPTAVTASVADNVLTISAISADQASVVVGAYRSGVEVQRCTVTLTKNFDGTKSNSGSANVTSMPNSTLFVQLGSFTLTVANGATLNVTGHVSWFAATGAFYAGEIKASYQNITDAGAETFGSTAAGDITATDSEQAIADCSVSWPNSTGAAKSVTVRIYGRRAAGTGAGTTVSGSVYGETA